MNHLFQIFKKDTEAYDIFQQRKKKIQDDFRKETGLFVDVVLQGANPHNIAVQYKEKRVHLFISILSFVG